MGTEISRSSSQLRKSLIMIGDHLHKCQTALGLVQFSLVTHVIRR